MLSHIAAYFRTKYYEQLVKFSNGNGANSDTRTILSARVYMMNGTSLLIDIGMVTSDSGCVYIRTGGRRENCHKKIVIILYVVSLF